MQSWTGVLVLAGLVAVGATDAAAQQLDAGELAVALRQMDFEADLVTDASVDVERPITNVDDALRLIERACECAIELGFEIPAIRIPAIGNWIDVFDPVTGPVVEAFCARFAARRARR